MKGSMKWGIVTIAVGFTSGTLGHYLPDTNGAAFGAVVFVSVIFGIMGMAALDE